MLADVYPHQVNMTEWFCHEAMAQDCAMFEVNTTTMTRSQSTLPLPSLKPGRLEISA